MVMIPLPVDDGVTQQEVGRGVEGDVTGAPDEYTGVKDEIAGELDKLTGGSPRTTGVQPGKPSWTAVPPDRDVVGVPATDTVGREIVVEVVTPLQAGVSWSDRTTRRESDRAAGADRSRPGNGPV